MVQFNTGFSKVWAFLKDSIAAGQYGLERDRGTFGSLCLSYVLIVG